METEKPWLLLDTNNLVWRNHYARPSNDPAEIVWNGLDALRRDVKMLCDRFQTDRVAFCFDKGRGRRAQEFLFYKANRTPANFGHADNPHQRETKAHVRRFLDDLREYLLPNDLGYGNLVYSEDGYEADDVIAKLVLDNNDLPFCVVSDDEDLYQLLHPCYTWMYQPRKKRIYTYDHFICDYGLAPHEWPEVKALAGCRGDGISGCPGIGETIASRYLSGILTDRSKRWMRCDEFVKTDVYKNNLKLVKLPYEGCPEQERPLSGVWASGPPDLKKLNALAARQGLPPFEDPDDRPRPAGVRRRK